MMHAKRHRGQNFLVDKNILAKIVTAADIAPGDTVLEVGPGLGALTELLVQKAKHVIAVEIDKELFSAVEEKFEGVSNLTLIKDDILECNPSAYSLGPRGYSVVANLPYNITSRFFRKFLEDDARPARMTVLIQREVAERMMVRPPDMNLLALSVQLFSDASLAFPVSRHCFSPKPKVESAVVVLEVKPERALPQNSIREAMFRLARAAFSQKRKQCAKALAKAAGLPVERVALAFERLGLDRRARAEEISLEQWVELAHSLDRDLREGYLNR